MSATDIVKRLVQVQDDEDTVVLPNACSGSLVQFKDDQLMRCFSVLTRQPHTVPPDAWTVMQTDEMPKIKEHPDVVSGILVDHVTRGIIGDNAFQLKFDDMNNVVSMRLLPPKTSCAQKQWEAQASKFIEE